MGPERHLRGIANVQQRSWKQQTEKWWVKQWGNIDDLLLRKRVPMFMMLFFPFFWGFSILLQHDLSCTRFSELILPKVLAPFGIPDHCSCLEGEFPSNFSSVKIGTVLLNPLASPENNKRVYKRESWWFLVEFMTSVGLRKGPRIEEMVSGRTERTGQEIKNRKTWRRKWRLGDAKQERRLSDWKQNKAKEIHVQSLLVRSHVAQTGVKARG